MVHHTPQQEHFILIIAALVLPPLAIFLVKKYSIWNKEFLVSVLLTMFGHVPGAVFTLYYLLCVEFPQSRDQGYNRLPDDEESRGGFAQEGTYQEQEQEQPQQSEQETGIYVRTSSSTSPPDESQPLQEGDLPAYEDIVQPLQTRVGDVKGSSDNKIQR
ncbi:hypothetical protein JA1_002357 [Spathaspora sp. JA1]|nr:hypothetical protein JA1_002357 [Spathaspora sp. JA1]